MGAFLVAIVLILFNLLIFLGLLGVLFILKRKGVSFSKRVLLGLCFGIVLGFVFQFIYSADSTVLLTSADWFQLIGGSYIKLLQMIAVPLIFISILSAFTRLTLTRNLGKISLLVVGLLVGTTAVAALIGITSAAGFGLEAIQIDQGEAETARGASLEETYETVENVTFPQHLLSLIPANPFLDMTGARPSSVIAVVIFAVFLGLAYLGIREKQSVQASFFADGVASLYAIVMKVVSLILQLTPYGVLAVMTKTVALTNLQAIAALAEFVAASYAALAAVFLVHLLLLAFSGLNPIVYLKKAIPVLVFAFTTRTSAGALPMNIRTQQQLGVQDGTANFAGSLGLSIGQNGCAGVYPAMLAIMIAPTVGINPLTPSFILTVVAITAISSFGVAGVGGGATFAAILVLSALDLPIGLAGILISIEPLIDMGRTAVNVSGSMTAGVLTSKLTGELDTSAYYDPDRVVETKP
ncbi:cation:dicarboxylase symporter family transporter [Jeotgalibacillus sp. ET6]|uniref:L-cystine transporter n=1 Tax=Jeotgalibacillus sp. ET6 TaxID=3037260 RepID=UPI0024188BAF|nr:cation:dicarboxylase symporter family transporter [Jeotgalibacillus sp. ET6]MDG5471844.1 cation:dicarboxylase symporter family transporter [Jeotgalibacillus sp. ET6]